MAAVDAIVTSAALSGILFNPLFNTVTLVVNV